IAGCRLCGEYWRDHLAKNAAETPAEGMRLDRIPAVDERVDGGDQRSTTAKRAIPDDASLQDAEPELDLVDPRSMLGRAQKMKTATTLDGPGPLATPWRAALDGPGPLATPQYAALDGPGPLATPWRAALDDPGPLAAGQRAALNGPRPVNFVERRAKTG